MAVDLPHPLRRQSAGGGSPKGPACKVAPGRWELISSWNTNQEVRGSFCVGDAFSVETTGEKRIQSVT